MFRAVVACAVFVCLSLYAWVSEAGTLERRAVFGAALTSNIPDDVRKAQNVPAGQGVLIVNVLAGLSAEKAGLKAGDIILSLSGVPTTGAADVQNAVRARRAGDVLQATYLRNGQKADVGVKLASLPLESAADIDIAYDEVRAGDSVRRTIITRPKAGGRHPAVLLAGGIGCYSIDGANKGQDAYRDLLYSLTRRGFVTMRVEKTGMGDSTGSPCATADLDNEVSGYVGALKELKRLKGVDGDRVFILGHSIGGVTGPLAAKQVPVRGLVVMETLGMTWYEYELINTRRQLKLSGVAPADIGAQMMLKASCSLRFLINREPREQILKDNAACADFMSYPASDAYLQQVASQNLEALWGELKGTDVAVIYGAADFVTGAAESQALVDAVNAARPGEGVYIEIPDMDHYLFQMGSQAESMQAAQSGTVKPLHPRLAGIVADWLTSRAR